MIVFCEPLKSGGDAASSVDVRPCPTPLSGEGDGNHHALILQRQQGRHDRPFFGTQHTPGAGRGTAVHHLQPEPQGLH